MRAVLCLLLTTATLHLGTPLRAVADDEDHEQARRAREAGEIVSLENILAAMKKSYDGKLVEVDLEHEDGRWEYEIELLTKDGKVLKLTYDAATSRLLEVDGEPSAKAAQDP